jgi:hypothetical protein
MSESNAIIARHNLKNAEEYAARYLARTLPGIWDKEIEEKSR